MKMDEIREIAKVMGIQSLSKFKKKEDLIWTIQLAEGNEDCFKREPDCEKQECTWHEDCIR